MNLLAEAGGEEHVSPTDGLEVKVAGSTGVKWHPMISWDDTAYLSFPEAPKDGVIAYAYAKINRAQGGRALISVGSNGGIRVWINGRPVLSHDGSRTLVPDEDQAEVDMAQGENTLLVKALDPKGSWTFTARVLETGAVLPRMSEIFPSVASNIGDEVRIRTDNG